MPSAPAVFDVEGLLSPIAGENPAGESMQYWGLHDQIREARRSDDALSQGDWQRELKTADWDDVIRLASDALAHKTKDLQICGWLAEAEVKKHGFPGLRDGLMLTRGLQERYWDQLYPQVEDGDMEARANSIAFLDKQCAMAVKEVPIVKASGVNASFLDFEQAKIFDTPPNPNLDPQTIEHLNQERARALEEGRMTSEGFMKARNATRHAFYEETYAVLNECWEQVHALDKVMDEKFGRQTPGLSGLQKSLEQVRAWVEKTVKEKRIEEPDASDVPEGAESGEPG